MVLEKLLKIKLHSNRIYGLDILRALAILFVVAGHGAYLMPAARYKYINYFVFDGVSIFFVLSGFLIGGILIKQLKAKKVSLKLIVNFWIRRWFRTLPNYFLILTVLLLLNYFFTQKFNAFNHKLYFIFSQNLFSEHPHFFPEAWSLSVEEWFYLLIPIIIFFLIKSFNTSTESAIILTAIGIIICITTFRYFRYVSITIDDIEVWDNSLRKQVFTRLDSLMFGVIGSYIWYYYETYWNKYRGQFLILGITLFIFSKFKFLGLNGLGLYHCVFSFTVTSLATLFIIPCLCSLKKGEGFFFKAFTYLSLISYSMYLVNLTIVQQWILGNIDWSLLQNFNGYLFLIIRYVLYWALTIIISILIYKYFEVPMMNLRDLVKMR